MRVIQSRQINFKSLLAAGFLFCSPLVTRGQTVTASHATELAADVSLLATTVQKLQEQVEMLNAQVSEMRASQQEAALQTEKLRAELNRAKEQFTGGEGGGKDANAFTASEPPLSGNSAVSTSSNGGQDSGNSLNDRISKLEDDQELLNDKILE